jgi:hypothetical protein
MHNGVNLNALTSQEVADMGGGPVFFSTLAEIEKVPAGSTVPCAAPSSGSVSAH